MGKIYSLSVSSEKGVRKENVDSVEILKNHGIQDDAHAGGWHRQVSFLAVESIEKMKNLGLDVKSGDFAENITTEGIDLCKLPVGSILESGKVRFVISQKGKICHNRCAIYFQAGDCIMPREGIFAEVLSSGTLQVNDQISVLPKKGLSVGIITLSDKGSRGERIDETAPALEHLLRQSFETSFIRKTLIADEASQLKSHLEDFCDTQEFDLIITNGSTGLSPRDIAPEATLEVIEKRLPGFEEAMRMESFKKTPHALISRAVCGCRKNSLIINLPGSPKGAVENFNVLISTIEHAISKLQGDKTDCAES
ncbi:MOSC domain-containing protein [Flexistipes sinusarabici]|uniref:MOSC domain-containing protein n=1 Tax=Flexistipes sinusarabici TaxID=2352 RepID=UPI002355D780|nr:MOSC domain-containing protein [Flexistipes sinusarabici]